MNVCIPVGLSLAFSDKQHTLTSPGLNNYYIPKINIKFEAERQLRVAVIRTETKILQDSFDAR